MMNKKVSIVLVLLTISSFYNGLAISTDTTQPPTELEFYPRENFVISLIGYDQNLVDTADLESVLPYFISRNQNYNINYDVQFANSSYSSTINNYIDSIKTPDWTSSLNQTALKEQKQDFGRKDIFTQQSGQAIPARQLENFLANNLPGTDLPDVNRYYIFVFNLTRVDDGQQHWLNATEVDTDSGRSRFFWRLEWDYPLNYDVKFPYAAFAENEELAIIDPTAFQWYLKWRMIWNTNVDAHESYNKTLTELVNDRQSLSDKKAIVQSTLDTWITDWVDNIFNMYTGSLDFGTSLEVQLGVAYNSTQKNRSDLEWIINDEEIVSETNTILQTSDLEVSITYYDVNNDTFTQDFLNDMEVSYEEVQGSPSPFEDWTYYDGVNLWNQISSNSMVNNKYFNTSTNDILVKGIILLLDNSSYVGSPGFIPWAGGLYTGLGGSQIVTMLWELGRAFMPDGETHKAGLSKVLIHEIGHSIGFPHTFDNHFTSDFASDVMGYYPGTSNYSKLITQAYQRNGADILISEVQDLYTNLYNENVTQYHDALIIASNTFQEGVEQHNNKQYVDAYFTMREVKTILNNPNDYTLPDDGNGDSSDPISSPDDTDQAFLPLFFFPLILPIASKVRSTFRRNG